MGYEEPEEGAAPAKAAPQGPVTAMTEAQLIELDNYLVDKSYITGYTITQDDVHEFSRVKSVPTGLVNLARWHRHVASYSDDFSTIPGDKRAPPQGCPAEYVAQAEAPAAEESDDDVDLFGSDDEEDDAEAERIKAERVAAYNKKKEEKESKKGKVIAKSNVIMDIKPWDDETDMKELEAAIRSITMDGLLWGTGKLVEIGYGIKKLQITTVIEDDKVMMDDLEEQIIAFEDFVQSMDIVAFNKI